MGEQVSMHHWIRWAVAVVAMFIVFGGAVGGFTTLTLFVLIALMQGSFSPDFAIYLPIAIALAAGLGVLLGFPAAAFTGAAYAMGIRRRLAILSVAFFASAVWGFFWPRTGFLLPVSNPVPGIGALALPAFFALIGVAGAWSSLWILKVWRFQAPD